MKNVTGGIKLTEIVHKDLHPDTNPFFPMRIRGFRSGSTNADPRMRIHNTGNYSFYNKIRQQLLKI